MIPLQVPEAAEAGKEPEKDRAAELFRSFLSNGREAMKWRKNDLRLINSFIVPWLFGSDARIDWSHPVLALDELEQLVKQAPEQRPGAKRALPDDL